MRNSAIYLLRFIFLFFYLNSFLIAQPNNDSAIYNRKKGVSYFPGIHAPLGLNYSYYFTSKMGISINSKINKNIFSKTEYFIEDRAITETAFLWLYSNDKKYGRFEANLNFIYSILKMKKNKVEIYAGAGFLIANYLYLFRYQSLNGDQTNRWILDNDLSYKGINTECGITLHCEDTNPYLFHLGISSVHIKSERMLTFGIGYLIKN